MSEAYDVWAADADKVTGYELPGSARTMLANRLSFFLDFKGANYLNGGRSARSWIR